MNTNARQNIESEKRMWANKHLLHKFSIKGVLYGYICQACSRQKFISSEALLYLMI